MTRAEILNDIIRITNQDYEAVRRMKAHDRSQREEIARLEQEVKLWRGYRDEERDKKRTLSEHYGKLCKAQRALKAELGGRIQRIERLERELKAALAKEATRDTAK